MLEYKARRIRAKMAEKGGGDARRVFGALDRDGGGSLDRRELAVGLFGLGVWLAPTELATLLEMLDEDGGGDIDLDEFCAFWDRYTFE